MTLASEAQMESIYRLIRDVYGPGAQHRKTVEQLYESGRLSMKRAGEMIHNLTGQLEDLLADQSKSPFVVGDVAEVLSEQEAETFDAMLCDPPYGLEFMGKDWDKVVPGPDVWRECLRVLKPGAFALVFGGTRTFHRLAVALEDAGFELRDTLMWVYGSGFPKSHDVSKAIDKLAGAEREAIGRTVYVGERSRRAFESIGYGGSNPDGDTRLATAPATPEAERWQGYGTALKPAWEPVLLVRKPTTLTFAQNAIENGAGALNIDGTRIGTHKSVPASVSKQRPNAQVYGTYGVETGQEGGHNPNLGRWPANLIHDGSEEVVELFPQTSAGAFPARRGHGGLSTSGHRGQEGLKPGKTDAGSAARFFYTAKASKSERDAGLDGLPLQSAGMMEDDNYPIKTGSGNLRNTQRRNNHPTVKPLALAEYLAKLLLVPERDTPRRILVPFAGVGSELIGAIRAGWDDALGIEREAEYVEIAEKRLAHWTKE